MLLFPILLLLTATGGWSALPKGWKACKLGTPGYDDCFVNAINGASKTMIHGHKQLEINNMEPLRILSMTIDQGSGPVRMRLDFTNIDISGLSSCVVRKINNTDWKVLDGIGTCNTTEIRGHYKVTGKIMALPIAGEGNCELRFEDQVVRSKIIMKEVEKGGEKYFHATLANFDITPKKASIHLDNLFNGNKALSDNMNKFMNENALDVFKELKPAISVAMAKAFSQIANKVFSKIPSKELNP